MTEPNTPSNSLSLISYSDAMAAISAGASLAKERGVTLSFVVLDAAGHLVASARMDGAPFITIEVARGKAFACAATGGVPGAALAQRFRDNPMIWGNAGALGYGAPMLPAQGALPIRKQGQLIGAMGASGAPSDVDEEVVSHAIAAIGGDPK